MKSTIALLVCVLIIGFWNAVLFNRPCGGNYVGLKDNGWNWFKFGPGLITTCNCARIRILWPDNKDGKWLEIRDASKIALIKKWVLDNGAIDFFASRTNFAPYWPDYWDENDRPFGPSVILYGPDTDIEARSLIVAIPLVPLAFGTTKEGLNKKLAQLKKALQ